MKKRFPKLLAFLCAVCLTVSITAPAFAAEVTKDPQEYSTTAVVRGPIIFPVSFGSDDIALYDQFAAMTDAQLVSYLNNLSPSTYSSNSSRVIDDPEDVEAAIVGFIALAALFVKRDFPCAAELVLYSLENQDYTETNGGLTEKIKQSPEFLSWAPTATAGSSKDVYYTTGDLYYSLRHVTLNCTYISDQGKVIYLLDTFDFNFEICETIKATILNDSAWILTQIGIMHEIDVEVSFLY